MINVDQDAKKLLLEIARCTVARKHCEGNVGPCSTIVSVQKVPSWDPFQVPEPWSGDLVGAPILFLSSNPSISDTEEFPTESWEDATVLNFFEGRFEGYWVRGGKPRNKDGTYRLKAVSYWSCIRNRAAELLEDPKPGVDFVLSEVVHCKSKKERGVKAALSTCAGRYLIKLLSCSGAAVIVLVGRKTFNYWNSLPPQLGLPKVPEREGTEFLEIAGRKRLFIFLPAPGGPEKKLFGSWVSQNKMNQIRSFLGK